MSKKVYAAYAEQPEAVAVHGSFPTTSGGSGNDPATKKGVGYTVTKVAAGHYRISFDNVYADMISFGAWNSVASTTLDIDTKPGDYTAGSGSTGAIQDVYTRTVDTNGDWALADPTVDDNNRINFTAVFKRVSDI